ncbi:hypothetical protein EDB89DRAFT_222039 [Lactarius sanguifluus]|nr:hypothetical protein EDB89DRAFT_222039 [Lactarius sanguifluus]
MFRCSRRTPPAPVKSLTGQYIVLRTGHTSQRLAYLLSPTFLIFLLRHWSWFFLFVLNPVIGLACVIYFYSDLLLRTFDLVALVVACDHSQHLMYIITTMGFMCTFGSCASVSFLQ